MTHVYFSARAEGRISYGHLGRTSLFISLFMKPTRKTVYTMDIKMAKRVLLAHRQLQGSSAVAIAHRQLQGRATDAAL